jgi:tetratricopeptide (TPR) repeat protein
MGMPDPSRSPDRRTPGRGPARRVPLAAPAAAGIAAAAATVLTTVLDVWELPVQAKIAVIALAALLVGLLTWATTTATDEIPGVADGEAATRPPDQWPPVPEHFTGRDEVLAELDRVFGARHRRRGRPPVQATAPLVVSLYGRGGVGKSALVARFGHQIKDLFPDGRLYADLRGVVDAPVEPEEVLIGFLRALGVRVTTDPGGVAELRKLWLTWTTGRRILIGLDNARDADQVRHLLPAEPGCAVIVTSRQPLFLLNAYDKQLTVFTEAQGMRLLARLSGDDRIAADLASAQEIVRMCDHLPLAISICGGRLATRASWSLRELADRLRDERRRLDQLELSRRTDKSVRASLQLSYDDCTEPQRRLLRLLGTVGTPDVPAWVAGELLDVAEPDGADQLEALIDAQLAEYSGADPAGRPRYRLHDLVRVFAAEIAGREEDTAAYRAAIERALSGYRRRAESAATARWPQDWGRRTRARYVQAETAAEGSVRRAQLSAADWLTTERLSLVAMINQARSLEMWEIAWGLGRAFCSLCHSLRAYWSDWRAVAEIAHLAAERTGDRRALGMALLERAAVRGGQGDNAAARIDAERALALFSELGEAWWAARAMRTIGMARFNDGHLDEAEERLGGAIAAFRAAGDRWWTARTQRNLAELLLAKRRPDLARDILEEALAVFQREGNRYSEAQTLRAYGEVLSAGARERLAQGDARGAMDGFAKAGFSLHWAAEMFRRRGEQWEEARCLRAAGEVGDPDNGLAELEHVRRAEEILSALGDSWGVARTELSTGRALARLRRYAEADAALSRATRMFEDLGDRWWVARSLRRLGQTRLEGGDCRGALPPLRRALGISRSLGNDSGVARTLELLRQVKRACPDLDCPEIDATEPC